MMASQKWSLMSRDDDLSLCHLDRRELKTVIGLLHNDDAEHLSCDKKHSIIDYFQDKYSCCLFLVALVCDARRRSRDQEKKKIKQI